MSCDADLLERVIKSKYSPVYPDGEYERAQDDLIDWIISMMDDPEDLKAEARRLGVIGEEG